MQAPVDSAFGRRRAVVVGCSCAFLLVHWHREHAVPLYCPSFHLGTSVQSSRGILLNAFSHEHSLVPDTWARIGLRRSRRHFRFFYFSGSPLKLKRILYHRHRYLSWALPGACLCSPSRPTPTLSCNIPFHSCTHLYLFCHIPFYSCTHPFETWETEGNFRREEQEVTECAWGSQALPPSLFQSPCRRP